MFRDPIDNIFTNTYALEQLPFSDSLPIWYSKHYQDIKLSEISPVLGKAIVELIDVMRAGERAEQAILNDTEFRRLLRISHDIVERYDQNEEDYETFSIMEDLRLRMEQLESFRNLAKRLEEFRAELDEIIEGVEELIRHINNRFEQDANWY